MKCNHENKMVPVTDPSGRMVGMVCDCGYFEHRKGLDPYQKRIIAKYAARGEL